MDIDKLLSKWLYNKEHSQEILEIANQNNMVVNYESLIRLWRIEFDDIDSIIRLEDFKKSLTPNERKALRCGEDLNLSDTSLNCLFDLKIKYYAHTKARSHSKSITGCNNFIDHHAEQISFKMPCFITKIENANGVDLANFGKKLKAKDDIIQNFDAMEEILSEYNYQQASFEIIKYPKIQIWSQNGELQVVRP